MKLTLQKPVLGLMLSLVLVALLLGCSSATQSTEVLLDKEFSLSVGQTATLKSENMTIRFEGVTEDSRCPIGATCILGGPSFR